MPLVHYTDDDTPRSPVPVSVATPLPTVSGAESSLILGAPSDDPWDGLSPEPTIFAMLKAIVIATQATAVNTDTA